jgi:excisionase family DNA binding protein|tara:strand:- start:1277 stop:1582 length:306 start_codon:yes stop_codon:yes gene_type:complete
MASIYVPIEELSKRLTVSIPTIRAWVRRGQVPTETYIKVGNTYRFCVEDVVDALRGTRSEIKPDTSCQVSDGPEALAADVGVAEVTVDTNTTPSTEVDDNL